MNYTFLFTDTQTYSSFRRRPYFLFVLLLHKYQKKQLKMLPSIFLSWIIPTSILLSNLWCRLCTLDLAQIRFPEKSVAQDMFLVFFLWFYLTSRKLEVILPLRQWQYENDSYIYENVRIWPLLERYVKRHPFLS